MRIEQHGGVKLDELDVADPDAGPECQSDAVAGGALRIGGGAVEVPRPPVATITEGACRTPTPSPLRTSTPVTADSSCRISRATWLRRMSRVAAAWSRARWTSAPVASPPACMMRRRNGRPRG